MSHFKNLEEAMCRELDKLDRKYGGEEIEMTPQDAERADLLYHALKSAATYHAMAEADEWEGEESERNYAGRVGRSYATRRRDSMGRYTSRGMDGGYMSGHYPMYPRYPEWPGEEWR